MKTPKVTRTLLDTVPPLSRTEAVDTLLDQLKQHDEAFFAAVVARMEEDEDFRRRVIKEAKRIGQGQRGGEAQNPALVRRIIRNFETRGGDDVKKDTIAALAVTLKVSEKQARNLYEAVMESGRTSIIHRIKK